MIITAPIVVVPSSDHCYTVPPYSDHYGTTKVAPPSDHLHTKIMYINLRKTFIKSLGSTPLDASAYFMFIQSTCHNYIWNMLKRMGER